MTKKLKPIPRFKSEMEERAYWEKHDSTQHIDWSAATRVSLLARQSLPEAPARVF